MGKLMLHCGADPVPFNQLQLMADPVPKSKTHMPIRHDVFVDMIKQSLNGVGDFEVMSEEYGLTQDGANLFGRQAWVFQLVYLCVITSHSALRTRFPVSIPLTSSGT